MERSYVPNINVPQEITTLVRVVEEVYQVPVGESNREKGVLRVESIGKLYPHLDLDTRLRHFFRLRHLKKAVEYHNSILGNVQWELEGDTIYAVLKLKESDEVGEELGLSETLEATRELASTLLEYAYWSADKSRIAHKLKSKRARRLERELTRKGVPLKKIIQKLP